MIIQIFSNAIFVYICDKAFSEETNLRLRIIFNTNIIPKSP